MVHFFASSSSDSLENKIFVSSAKWYALKFLMASNYGSFIYNRKGRGPRTEPYGTPAWITPDTRYGPEYTLTKTSITFMYYYYQLQYLN